MRLKQKIVYTSTISGNNIRCCSRADWMSGRDIHRVRVEFNQSTSKCIDRTSVAHYYRRYVHVNDTAVHVMDES